MSADGSRPTMAAFLDWPPMNERHLDHACPAGRPLDHVVVGRDRARRSARTAARRGLVRSWRRPAAITAGRRPATLAGQPRPVICYPSPCAFSRGVRLPGSPRLRRLPAEANVPGRQTTAIRYLMCVTPAEAGPAADDDRQPQPDSVDSALGTGVLQRWPDSQSRHLANWLDTRSHLGQGRTSGIAAGLLARLRNQEEREPPSHDRRS